MTDRFETLRQWWIRRDMRMVAGIILATDERKIARTMIEVLMMHKLVMCMPMRDGGRLEHTDAEKTQNGEDSHEQFGHFGKLPGPPR